MTATTFLASGRFWFASLERAVKTIAQAAVATLSAGALGVLDIDWLQLASIAGLAGLVSVLTSVASGAATDGTPSLVPVSEATGRAATVPADAAAASCPPPDAA